MFCLGFHRVQIKISARLGVYPEALAKNLLLSLLGLEVRAEFSSVQL